MKKTLIFILSVAAMIFTAGCGGSQPEKQVFKCQIEGAAAPEWVCNGGADYKDGVYAVGSAPKSPLGINFQRTEAIAAARNEIARQLDVKVKNLFKSYLSSTGVKDDQTAERVVTDVTKQITNKSLSGTKLLKTWFSPKGTMYVLVGVDKESLKNNIIQSARTTFKNDEALWQEFKAKKAQDELDAAIDKEFSR